MALSRRFVWVKVNRDHTPAIPKRYGVTAYPTLLTLGDRDEQVHRFQSFQKPKEFRASLSESLRRWGLYRKGEKWDLPDARPASIVDRGTVETLPAPSEAVPEGLCVLDGRLWVSQDGLIRPVDPVTGEAGPPVRIPTRCVDLATDGKHLFAVPYGWTKGDAIVVVDPESGKVVRQIVTEKNRSNRASGTKGATWHAQHLWLLSGMKGTVHVLDPSSGEVARTVQLEGKWLAGLHHDGRHLVCGGRTSVTWFDPETGKKVREVPVNYPVRCIAAYEGKIFLMEQPVFGHDREHRRVRIWPTRMLIHRWTPPAR